MKTALTKEINGKTIIIGFSDPVIDPVETEKKILALKVLDESDETRKLKAKIKEIGDRQRMGMQAMKEHARLKYVGQAAQSETKRIEAIGHYNKVDVLMAENKPLIESFKNKKKELVRENAVYFQPKPSEVFIEDEQHETLTQIEIGEFAKLCIDGNVIPDYSEQTIYQKVKDRWIIVNLDFGESFPIGAILNRDLTDEQKVEISTQTESDRIIELSAIDKETEKNAAIDNAAIQAARMRSVLEIQSDRDALTKAQEWYNEQLLIIEEKYS